MPSGRKTDLTAAQRCEIARRYLIGEGTLASLMAEYQIGPRTLRGILQEFSVSVRRSTHPSGSYGPRRELTPEIKREIAQRYASGESLEELCKEYHHGRPVMRGILRECGVAFPAFGRLQGVTMNTPIEQRLQDALKRAGIGFSTGTRPVKPYLADIELHQARVVIEADGAWHNTAEAREYDARRDAAFAAAGYRVFRFCTAEINRDAALCVQQVADACGLAPDEDPQFHIRMVTSGEFAPNWKGGRQVFTCTECGELFEAQPDRRRGNKFCGRSCYYRSMVGKPSPNKGKPQSAEARAKISAALIGNTYATGGKGKPKSPEHRAKISTGLQRHYQAKR